MVILRPEVNMFAYEMERILCENDHKGGWSKCSLLYLMGRLTEEMAELEFVLKYKMTNPHCTNKKIQKKAINMANYAMMIWDRLEKEKANGNL